MRLGIDMGHTLKGADYGAVGIKNESDCTREIGLKVIDYLQRLGHTVIDCTIDYAESIPDSLNKRIAKANAQHLDLFISIHMDCVENVNANGVTAYIHNETSSSVPQAKSILDKLVSQGYFNRGLQIPIKYLKKNLAVLQHTYAPAMLIECGYLRNEGDMNRYNASKIAKAIVEGATGQEVPMKYYIVTNYIPAGPYGIEILELIEKYFRGFERIYMKSNNTGMWIETQYLSKPEAEALAEKLKADNLLWELVEE